MLTCELCKGISNGRFRSLMFFLSNEVRFTPVELKYNHVCVCCICVFVCIVMCVYLYARVYVYVFWVLCVCTCGGVCMDICMNVYMWSFPVLTTWFQINTLRLTLVINA